MIPTTDDIVIADKNAYNDPLTGTKELIKRAASIPPIGKGNAFKGILPNEYWIDKDVLMKEIEAINDTEFNVRYIAIYLSQTLASPPSSGTWATYPYSTNPDYLLPLFAFLNYKDELINNTFYNFQLSKVYKFNTTEANFFFQRYKEENQFYDQFEKIHANNTRIIHFTYSDLKEFNKEAMKKSSGTFKWIKLTSSEVDAYSKDVLENPTFRLRYNSIHKQFHFIFDAYIDTNTEIKDMPSYDINSLCPPECNHS